MIRINQIRSDHELEPKELKKKAGRALHVRPEELQNLKILKKSVDARRKDRILYIYSVLVTAHNEKKLVQKANSRDVSIYQLPEYRLPRVSADSSDAEKVAESNGRPVIVGFGPAGMFCALSLASAGLRPIVLERGSDVDTRSDKVKKFWEGGELDPESNTQFGEGGAGTFSDGKLNTLVHDESGRNRFVLDSFVRFGADKAILTDAKPHIGSDVLRVVVKNLREEVIRLGGEVRFNSCFTGYEKNADGKICKVQVNNSEWLECGSVILAPGHSARDTFAMLFENGLGLEPKAFAVGVRVQHRQELINRAQYGDDYSDKLPASPYKVTAKASDGRGVYSFCMCPGGYVVNASSEPGMLAVNGMSYSARDGENANSAIVVTVTPEDFGSSEPLAGIAFQRELEKKAFEAANGKIPCQRFEDFRENRLTEEFGLVKPQCCGLVGMGNLRQVLPEFLSHDIIEGMEQFGRKIRGFDDPDVILAGVESRTSSPVRIPRRKSGESEIDGLFPAGEGAGYAGGIMSAAMDGLKTAENVVRFYKGNM
ncbi:hypothetical protein SAMN06296386_104169 [Lachnospiraceae bacterium]|nr:hypothetical protein SAMN06296386_104169 [Lachnospiraceae bacterium]